jgi:hypothetical protein
MNFRLRKAVLRLARLSSALCPACESPRVAALPPVYAPRAVSGALLFRITPLGVFSRGRSCRLS